MGYLYETCHAEHNIKWFPLKQEKREKAKKHKTFDKQHM